MENRPCLRCKGTKTVSYANRTDPCSSCNGTGSFYAPNLDAIKAAIYATQGKNKGKLRASMVSTFNDHDKARAYYVWRLARFHGGKDVTMPGMADFAIRGDSFKSELDKYSEIVAKESFGTDLAGAARWARAFGIIVIAEKPKVAKGDLPTFAAIRIAGSDMTRFASILDPKRGSADSE